MKKEIIFRVTSYEGDTEYKMLPKNALSYLRELEAEQDKWVFIDGEHKSAKLLSEQDLINATTENKDIIAMNAIAGGDGVIKTELVVDKKQKASVVIDLDIQELGKVIRVSVSDKQLLPILNNRDILRRALQLELNDKAEAMKADMIKPIDAKWTKITDEYETKLNELAKTEKAVNKILNTKDCDCC